MLPSGVDLTNFNKNPIVLFAHDSHTFPVGKALNIKKTRSGLIVKYVLNERPPSLPPEQEFIPDTLLHMLKAGTISGHSIGFTIKEDGIREATEKDREDFGKSVEAVITAWELLEFSIVPLPSNQDALAIAVSKGICSASFATTLGWVEKPKPTLSFTTLDFNVLEL
ncbi:MAG: HK97 family phage prohead protease [Planctomycetes bacterium]|nr:HK97 family phage prohead protease [Planctomycetota bacterium]